ncbi:MAG: hypothetical protein M1818_004998 [Claussenomyces sp. TS43310]|nr:MAG: hypothetical protein M1818_004998 [Claussenomyces sp. TS43310]
MRLSAQVFISLVASAISPAWSLEPQQALIAPLTSISQPLLGFGTWNLKISSDNTSEAVSLAIQTGYRQIDCAAIYGNEKAVGKGIADGLKKANLTRDQIWVTSKLWNDHHEDPALVEAALLKTLDDLGLDYLDLYLMHWPVGNEPGTKTTHLDYVETWRCMIALPKTKVLHLGISNFSPSQLKTLIKETGVKPFAHQMELHPYLQQSSWVATHNALGISLTAYSPLGNSNPTYRNKDGPPPLLENVVMVEIANRANCTPAQVALAWGMRRGTSVIPKSSHPSYILENFESLSCELGYEDFVKLRLMGRRNLKRFNNPSKPFGVKLFEGLDDA